MYFRINKLKNNVHLQTNAKHNSNKICYRIFSQKLTINLSPSNKIQTFTQHLPFLKKKFPETPLKAEVSNAKTIPEFNMQKYKCKVQYIPIGGIGKKIRLC